MTTATETAPVPQEPQKPQKPQKASVGSRAFGLLQKIGKSVMLPVSVLPVAGILLGVGGAFIGGYQQRAKDMGICVLDGAPSPCNVEDAVGAPVAAGLVGRPLYTLLEVMQASGQPIFSAMALIFAIGVALGLTKNDGVAALAAVVGYLVMNGTLGVVAAARGVETTTVLGQETLDTSVFGGILIGGIAAYMFNRFYRIQLPQYLGFFAGKRFVPIVTAFSAIVLGIVLAFVWPPIGYLIDVGANGLVREFHQALEELAT